MSISAEMVRKLREETGAGMMECKSALVEAAGDNEKARDILRKKGLAAAAKKATRTASDGMVGTYIHPGAKIGVLVEVNCETDFVAKTQEFQTLVKDVAMHIAASSPLYVTKDEVPAEILEKEKEIYKAQAATQGKPANVQEKIAEGKLKQYYTDFCLLEQPFVKDTAKTV
ncbi:MAG TPA: translation elongation factor Ts, partial [Vicinamibacteria bacterium]|nr:translation elongation factor Ts [Vicinamibacteria bacterium]